MKTGRGRFVSNKQIPNPPISKSLGRELIYNNITEGIDGQKACGDHGGVGDFTLVDSSTELDERGGPPRCLLFVTWNAKGLGIVYCRFGESGC